MCTYLDLEDVFREHWFQYILKYQKMFTDVSHVASNDLIDQKIIDKYPEFPWDDNHLIFNNSLSWDFFKKRFTAALDEGPIPYNSRNEQHWRNNKAWTQNTYAWEFLSEHPQINIHDIYERREQAWDFPTLITHRNVTWTDIVKYFIHGPLTDECNKHYIIPQYSSNPNVSITYMLEHPYLHWDWSEILLRPDISMIYLQRIFPKLDLSDTADETSVVTCNANLSRCPALTWEFILSHPEVNWDWSYISCHGNITIEFHPRVFSI